MGLPALCLATMVFCKLDPRLDFGPLCHPYCCSPLWWASLLISIPSKELDRVAPPPLMFCSFHPIEPLAQAIGDNPNIMAYGILGSNTKLIYHHSFEPPTNPLTLWTFWDTALIHSKPLPLKAKFTFGT